MDQDRQAWLDRLFGAYRKSFFEIDPSPEFIPSIWARIEEEQQLSWVFPLRQWATRLVTAAVAAILILGGILTLSNGKHTLNIRETSYVDALTERTIEQEEGDVWMLADADNVR